jgi:transcriptional regulator with XRE-family HTH domain
MPAMAEQSVLDFAGLLRQLRAEARLTQEELAEAASLSPRSVSDLERGINRTARKDTAELLAGALGLAEPARAVFVAAARGKAPAAEVLAAVLGEASAASDGPAPAESLVWSGCPYLGLVPFGERDARVFYGRGELVALDSTVKLFDVTDPEHSSLLGLDLTGTSVYSLAFSPEGRILAGGHHGGAIQLWDVADPANLRPLGQPLTGGGAQVNSVACGGGPVKPSAQSAPRQSLPISGCLIPSRRENGAFRNTTSAGAPEQPVMDVGNQPG